LQLNFFKHIVPVASKRDENTPGIHVQRGVARKRIAVRNIVYGCATIETRIVVLGG